MERLTGANGQAAHGWAPDETCAWATPPETSPTLDCDRVLPCVLACVLPCSMLSLPCMDSSPTQNIRYASAVRPIDADPRPLLLTGNEPKHPATHPHPFRRLKSSRPSSLGTSDPSNATARHVTARFATGTQNQSTPAATPATRSTPLLAVPSPLVFTPVARPLQTQPEGQSPGTPVSSPRAEIDSGATVDGDRGPD